jgi:glutathionylspermidine synthase
MRRELVDPRPNWRPEVERLGLIYHTPNGVAYWDESACYRFSSAEIDEIEAATEELQQLCLKAGQFIIDNDRFADLHIPPAAIPAIKDAWEKEPPSIYGRFDLAYDGRNPPKLLEYNAQTPTALLEASVVQWYWRQEVRPATDQFNSIHEKLIAKWQDLRSYLKGDALYFMHVDDAEDMMTVSYLRDTAGQAGIRTSALRVGEVGWNESGQCFRDLEEKTIRSLFALYPWEWLLGEFGGPVLKTCGAMDWIEPIWKMMWSNKGLLAILWEMFPEHPNLLEARIGDRGGLAEYVRKPLLSREGANVSVHTANGTVETGGDYGEEGYVYQALAPIPCFDGNRPVLGSWYITDQGPAGMGIRESKSPITDNLSRFVPHYFD